MKAYNGLLHNGEELRNGFVRPNTLDALNSKLTIRHSVDTLIFFNVLHNVFIFFLLVLFNLKLFLYM